MCSSNAAPTAETPGAGGPQAHTRVGTGLTRCALSFLQGGMPADATLQSVNLIPHSNNERKAAMKSLILWICGVPIGVIILLKIFGVF
jgi:hypothetical protein